MLDDVPMLDAASKLESVTPSRLGGLDGLLRSTVGRAPQGCAIDFFGRRWSWAQIGQSVDRVAMGL